MSKKRAAVALQYRVKLIGPDGAEWEWRITDSYFDKRMAKIEEEMLVVIREHDLSYEFGITTQCDDKPKFVQCEYCKAISTSPREWHRSSCTRPRRK